MSIYIKNDDGSFRVANDIDLLNRGYESTQRVPSIPSQDYQVSVFVSKSADWSQNHAKIKAIKVIRTAINKHYTTDNNGYFTNCPKQQKGIERPYGLKHIKWLVEQVSIENKITRLTVSMSCLQDIKSDLSKEGLDITFTMDNSEENNLTRLQAHREKLLKEINKIDDLIAWQLYG